MSIFLSAVLEKFLVNVQQYLLTHGINNKEVNIDGRKEASKQVNK